MGLKVCCQPVCMLGFNELMSFNEFPADYGITNDPEVVRF